MRNKQEKKMNSCIFFNLFSKNTAKFSFNKLKLKFIPNQVL